MTPLEVVNIQSMEQQGRGRRTQQHPSLLRYTDNIRILEGLSRSWLISPPMPICCARCIAYRSAAHRQALAERRAGAGDQFADECARC